MRPFVSFQSVLLCIAVGPAACLPLPAQTASRTPLPLATIMAALTDAGLQAEAAQIELPGPLSTESGDPQLRVTDADLLPDGRLRIRFACRRAGDCQPFLATVQSASSPSQLEAFVHRRKGVQEAASSHPEPAARLLAGQHATLSLVDDRMRITVPVLAIDSGVPGTEVRVSSLDHKQIFRAVVTGTATVRGSLP